MAGPHLVGVLEDEVLPLVQSAADVDDAAQYAPGVLHAQVDLRGELVGLELLGAQDHMAGRVLDVVAGHVPENPGGGGSDIGRLSGDTLAVRTGRSHKAFLTAVWDRC